MLYKFLLLSSLMFLQLNAIDFKEINPKPSKTMIENQYKAQHCSSPFIANEKISEDFKYGCFCGKDYPQINNDEIKDFRKLTKAQRAKIIESYFLIKPYDDIDAICQQHDICYLYQGNKTKTCNRAIYSELKNLNKQFKEEKNTLHKQQCRHLASDIASVFKTIFASGDDENGMFEMGALFFNTSLTMAQKTVEKSIETILGKGSRYPKANTKCLISHKTD
ncbi:MAG: Unknown protein [uncultured Sulfurovum sp.]|uniref:Uncharacterized protein n=1 Tax=uncultured Sulfurovum sp. TaxID=269237 RepID=A0A6S6T5A0_9BACT|nr:MAG: Unknown protein [uncultured Sulfurovum sp.]